MLGLVVAVVAALLVVWLLAGTLVNTSSLGLNAAISDSRILRSLDDVLPAPPSVFSRVQGFLSAEGFPPVFAGSPRIGRPGCRCPVTPSSARPSAAGASTVKIVGDGCGQIQEGSGFVVAPGVVVTNAHVVAGIADPTVEDASGTHGTRWCLFDPSYDLAVMRVARADRAGAPARRGHGRAGDPGGGPRLSGGRPVHRGAAGVMAEFTAQGRDIYGQGLTVRDVYEIQAAVRPGNSGGPLVQPDGEVIGVVFSRSTTNGDIGYALTSPGVLARVQRAESATGTVGTGGCTPG